MHSLLRLFMHSSVDSCPRPDWGSTRNLADREDALTTVTPGRAATFCLYVHSLMDIGLSAL